VPTSQFTAIAGQPFGVASLSIPIGQVEAGRLPRVVVSDADGRVFYPAVDLKPLGVLENGSVAGSASATPMQPERRIGRGGLVDRVRNVIRQTQETIDPPRLLRIQFLFVGDSPLKVLLAGDYASETVVIPVSGTPEAHRALIEGWWDGYTNQANRQLEASDYPPCIETYLCEMLASRLDLPAPDLRSKREIAKADRNVPLSTLELLGGVESLRDQIMRASLYPPSQTAAGSPASSAEGGSNASVLVPIPASPRWTELIVPEVPADLPLEKIADHVPPECFYLRFERFSNYLWFQQLVEAQGRGISQMVMMRGVDYRSDQRVQQMLNTKMTLIAKLFGDAIIQDVALIGLDLYMQDGPAIGVLFESASPGILVQSLDGDRIAVAAAQRDQGVQLEDLEILGSQVSFLSSPDNRIRSFLVRSGNYILVTTSKTLCTRFLEVEQGSPSMATNPSFQYARMSLPTQNGYSLFAFFSPQFFQSLVSPKYTIELRRRFRAISHLQLAEMATFIDEHESEEFAESSEISGASKKPLNIPSLIAKKLLPSWFLEANPESQPIFQASRDGGKTTRPRWIDSARGARGSFIPIADMNLEDCTAEEAASYVDQSSYYVSHWQQTDPLAFGVRRFKHPSSDSVERLAVEAYVAPLGRDKYGWVSQMLAEPVRSRIELPTDDIANIQLHLSGQSLFGFAPVENHVLFAGVKDMVPPPPTTNPRLLEILRAWRTTPGYLGAWPLPGYLDRLPIGLGGGPADPFGFSRLLIGAWRWQSNGFSVLSFDKSILEESAPYLKKVPAKDPAQARAMIADLEGSKVASWVNTYWYRRGLQASRGNARLMDTIQTQFQIPASQSKDVAERLIDGILQCPLGGTYSMVSSQIPSDTGALWHSSAWPPVAAPGISASIKGASSTVLATPNAAGLAMNPEKAFPPAEYSAPWLGWFRGGQIHLTQLTSQLILVAQIDLEKLPPVPLADSVADTNKALPSMNFDVFTLPFSIFGKGQ